MCEREAGQCVGGSEWGVRAKAEVSICMGRAGGRDRGLITYKGIGQRNKENKSQVSYCHRTIIQIWEGSK